MFIPDDVWNYIKTFLFHDIKIHGKHLKNDKYVKKYNNVVKIFPFLIKKYNGPRIIYNSAKKGTRIVKFVYVLRHNRIRKLIIVYQKMFHEYRKELSDEEVAWSGLPTSHISEFKEEYDSYIKQSITEN